VVPGTSFAVPPSALNVDVIGFWYGVSAASGRGTHTRVGPEGSSTSARVTISNVRQPLSGEEDCATAARARGAAGALMDGCTRDVKAIRAMQFPVFHGGIGPLDSKGRGRIMAIDVPIECGGVKVATGDLIMGDADGVVVIPQRSEAEVLRLAFEKVQGEKNTLADLQRGDELADVFARYGIL
jgi:regulator of RNase E activity RraA